MYCIPPLPLDYDKALFIYHLFCLKYLWCQLLHCMNVSISNINIKFSKLIFYLSLVYLPTYFSIQTFVADQHVTVR